MPPSAHTHRVRVVAKSPVASDVVEVVLAAEGDQPLPGWEPGAHVTLMLTEQLSREYSLCGTDPNDGTWTVAVHRAPKSRGGSVHVHAELAVGTRLTVSGPINNFRLDNHDRYVFVAGGIGITPIIAMVRHLRGEGVTDFTLLYCGRTASLMAYADELRGWDTGTIVLHADDEHGGPPDIGALLTEHAGDTIYCCGPEPLIDAVEKKAPDNSPVRTERFTAREIDRSADIEFDIVISGTRDRVHVGAAETILDALARSGYDVPSSCREGVCGTCETAVVSGVPEHRDSVLTDQERTDNEVMMPCVSRARGAEIELDLF